VPDCRDEQFAALEGVRPHREFCWTAAPVLCHAMVRDTAEGDTVVYVDADLMFYTDPTVLLDELGADKTIMIHEHRYSPDRKAWEPGSGRFNVGFVAFRVGDEARRCVARWREQVLDTCVLDPDRGLCGDQGYLNEWPDLYPGLQIMRNIGGGVAPWNLAAYEVAGTTDRPAVNGTPVVFFHFHAFKLAQFGGFGPWMATPARGYDMGHTAHRLIFRPYAAELRRRVQAMRAAGFMSRTDEEVGLLDGLRSVRRGVRVFALAAF
jgi:hypothetical protein